MKHEKILRSRRAVLSSTATAGVIAVAGCTADDDSDDDDDTGTDADADDAETGDDDTETDDVDEAGYEIWALDQGQDNIHIYEPAGDDEFEEVELIDVNELENVPDEGVVPHMIDYSADYEYAAIACTAGQRVLVFRTEDRELVGNIETGAGSHFASFSPGDEYLHVDVIHEDKIARIDADLDAETFEHTEDLELLEDDVVQEAGIESASPICHQFDHQGRSIHTLGPGYADAGLVIVDHDEFAVETAWSQEELPTNCGTMPHPEEEKFYLTAGDPSESPEDEDGIGEFYVLDTANDEIRHEGQSTNGVDAHGFWYTPDGEELWVLNRETNDGVIVDPDTDEIVDDIDAFGPSQSADHTERDAPDIMWASPDGAYMFVTLRGPVPLSGDPHAATGVTPGFSVLRTDDAEITTVVEPDPIAEYDESEIESARLEEDDAPRIPDFHGIGVRVVGDYETTISSSPPF